ncbi:hypothetical protein [Streptomyces koyangensis]
MADGLTVGELGAPAEWNAGKAADQGEFAELAHALRYAEAHGIG